MKKVLVMLALGVTAVIATVCCQSSGLNILSAAAPHSENEIKWLSWDEALAQWKQDKANGKAKKVFIDVYTDWCHWCKVMDNKTFSDPKVAAFISDNYYPVKFNAESTTDLKDKDGKVYSFVQQGRRGYHQLAAQLLNGQLSFPTVVFLDEEFTLIQPVPGYREVDEFKKIASYFATNSYKNTDWETYQRNYKEQ